MYEIKKIMNTDVVSVKRDTPIYDAVELLVKNNITGLPVVNDDMTLAGIISEKDMIGLLSESGEISGVVEDYMTTDIVSFEEDADLIEVCECLLTQNFRRVPILKDGKLVGIISRKDIVRYILEPIG